VALKNPRISGDLVAHSNLDKVTDHHVFRWYLNPVSAPYDSGREGHHLRKRLHDFGILAFLNVGENAGEHANDHYNGTKPFDAIAIVIEGALDRVNDKTKQPATPEQGGKARKHAHQEFYVLGRFRGRRQAVGSIFREDFARL
jgi:hypothetical protein